MKAVNFIFFVVCVVVASADTKFSLFEENSLIDPRIIGGKDAEKGQFPYQVSLRQREKGNHFCGASIISNRFILTAAHCSIVMTTPDSIYAVLGAMHLDEGGVTVNIDKITVHEGFDMNTGLKNDVCLLRTAEEIKFNEFIQPIPLPKQNLPDGTPALLSGWGKTTRSFPPKPSNELKFTETSTISTDQCKKIFRRIPILGRLLSSLLDESMVCTFKDKKVTACNGDSGGPLADTTDPEHKSLIGIVSWGAPNCMAGNPSVFMRVHSHLDWIQGKIEEQSRV